MELDEITGDWIGTKFMLADGLTKVLPGPPLSDMSKLGLMVHFRANVPGTTVHMVRIPEYGTIGPWQKQENAPRCQRNLFLNIQSSLYVWQDIYTPCQ